MRLNPPKTMNASQYSIVADIIRKIPDAEMRQAVANHFATEFNRRSRSFFPPEWEKATGGKPAPGSAA